MPLSNVIPSLAAYTLAAIAEIAGCFAFWAWLRLDRSALWLVPGLACLVLFAVVLTRIEVGFAGRAYAAYGGVYIVASVGWLWIIERQIPTRWDLVGATFGLFGMAVILIGPTLQR